MKKFENFCKALQNLKEINDYQEPYGNVILTGMVGLYEVCFELSWKAMKECLEQAGFAESQTGSPRQILKTAYQAGMIQEENLWLEALVARNNVAHSYNEAVALDIVRNTKMQYIDMFENLKDTLEKNWLE